MIKYNVTITCPFSKESLIKRILDELLDIPLKLDVTHETDWYPARITKCDYRIYTKNNINIRSGDIIRIRDHHVDIVYNIITLYYVYNDVYYDAKKNKEEFKVSLQNTKTKEYTMISASELMNMIDKHDVSFEHCAYISDS